VGCIRSDRLSGAGLYRPRSEQRHHLYRPGQMILIAAIYASTSGELAPHLDPRVNRRKKLEMNQMVGVTGFEPATSTSRMKFVPSKP